MLPSVNLSDLPQLASLSQVPPITDTAGIGGGEVHVWYCAYDDVRDERLLARYGALMNDREQTRHDRLYFERDRHMFLVTRALVRTVLSRYAPFEPHAFAFEENAYGRPHLAAATPGPHFNLSNTRGLIACAVAATERVGVDVENVTRPTEPLEIADRFFSSREVLALRRLPAAEHRTRFFALWTLKEAYIKARGMGLAIPLGQFSYELDDGPISISFSASLADTPNRWRFALLRASDEHVLAVAVDAPDGQLRAQRCVPFVTP